jgi:hypothetical protein
MICQEENGGRSDQQSPQFSRFSIVRSTGPQFPPPTNGSMTTFAVNYVLYLKSFHINAETVFDAEVATSIIDRDNQNQIIRVVVRFVEKGRRNRK